MKVVGSADSVSPSKVMNVTDPLVEVVGQTVDSGTAEMEVEAAVTMLDAQPALATMVKRTKP